MTNDVTTKLPRSQTASVDWLYKKKPVSDDWEWVCDRMLSTGSGFEAQRALLPAPHHGVASNVGVRNPATASQLYMSFEWAEVCLHLYDLLSRGSVAHTYPRLWRYYNRFQIFGKLFVKDKNLQAL